MRESEIAIQNKDSTATFTQLQRQCQKQYSSAISPNFVLDLLPKLITLGILTSDEFIPPNPDGAVDRGQNINI